MTLLSKRQQIAKAISTELDRFDGVWVLNALPLDDGQRLRIQVLPPAGQVLQMLRDVGRIPIFVSMLPRVMTNGKMPMCEIYEVDIPHEKQPIVDDRVIHGEKVAEGNRVIKAEVEATLKHIGWYK